LTASRVVLVENRCPCRLAKGNMATCFRASLRATCLPCLEATIAED
jgi:hypothetical protein